MNTEKGIRILAGTLVLVSVGLAHYRDNPYWLWLAVFVGINLIQSSFTGFCPAEWIMKKLGVPGTCTVSNPS